MTDREDRTCAHCVKREDCRTLKASVIQKMSGKPMAQDDYFEIMEAKAPGCEEYAE
ncbi:MAG: hypothetical protein WC359_12885 [Dehalococcoidia bacterium]|jgi:hypothetical protein